MYINDLKTNLSELETSIEDELYLGDVTAFSIDDGSSSNSSIEISFILGAYKFSYTIILTNETFKMIGYVDNVPKLKYDGTKDYTLTHNAYEDSEYMMQMIEYHLLKFFGKTVTDEYEDVLYNNKVVITESKMVRNKKVKLVMEKKMKDRAETEDMNYALQDMFMYFMNKPFKSRNATALTVIINEAISLSHTIDYMMKKRELADVFEIGFNHTTFINTNLTVDIIDIILDNLADAYGFTKDRFKEVYLTYGSPQERKAFEIEVNAKMSTLLSLAFGSEEE